MLKLKISHLEWHVTHACNLSCQGCLHFSDFDHKGIISYETLEEWYKDWSPRLSPRTIDILGGEPLLNKQIEKIIELTRKYWDSPYLEKLNLQSNGLLLCKYPNLPKVLKENNCHITLSKHYDNDTYNVIFEKSAMLLDKWKSEFDISYDIVDFYTYWTKFYKGYGSKMEPYEDGDYKKSWDNCLTGQDCFQIHEGKIYKCAPLAYLPMMKKKFNLSEKWDYYLTYAPLNANANDEEVLEFFNRGAESFCAMCPVNTEMFKKPDPLKFKRGKYL